jgi:hypothetical protein
MYLQKLWFKKIVNPWHLYRKLKRKFIKWIDRDRGDKDKLVLYLTFPMTSWGVLIATWSLLSLGFRNWITFLGKNKC